VAGPLLARFKKTRFSLPGGCSIGLRPIDIHLEAFKRLGAEISREKGNVVLTAKKLKAARVRFRFPSVGATENIMMCATLIEGRTVLENCAREPEIADLAAALRKMGARIKGEGTSVIEVSGVDRLKGLKHTVMADRIETGTFMLACAAAGGRVRLTGVLPKTIDSLTRHLRLAGVGVEVSRDVIEVNSSGARPGPVNVITRPYPGFPTDLQAPWMAFMARSKGLCVINERIFENRFIHAAELCRMGADIAVSDKKARIRGVESLLSAPVMASDLRAGAALVIAALTAGGKTLVRRIYHIDRGYEKFEDKLRRLGADIERIKS